MKLGLLAAALLLIAARPPSEADINARVARAPKDVGAFIERRTGCNHFLGEEPYDRERAAELDRAIRKLRCDRLDPDERRLRRTYRDKAAILRLLDDAADSLG